jgi:hypothetical protein
MRDFKMSSHLIASVTKPMKNIANALKKMADVLKARSPTHATFTRRCNQPSFLRLNAGFMARGPEMSA